VVFRSSWSRSTCPSSHIDSVIIFWKVMPVLPMPHCRGDEVGREGGAEAGVKRVRGLDAQPYTVHGGTPISLNMGRRCLPRVWGPCTYRQKRVEQSLGVCDMQTQWTPAHVNCRGSRWGGAGEPSTLTARSHGLRSSPSRMCRCIASPEHGKAPPPQCTEQKFRLCWAVRGPHSCLEELLVHHNINFPCCVGPFTPGVRTWHLCVPRPWVGVWTGETISMFRSLLVLLGVILQRCQCVRSSSVHVVRTLHYAGKMCAEPDPFLFALCFLGSANIVYTSLTLAMWVCEGGRGACGTHCNNLCPLPLLH
jgi:hypothetical protein